MIRLVDFGWGRPSPQAIKAAGVQGVIRYLSIDPTKAISVSEASMYHAADLPFALVYEDRAEDFTSPASGIAKAKIAATQLTALQSAGVWSAHRPVYCAVDGNLDPSLFPATWASVCAFALALGRPAAIYGPRPFLSFAEAKGCHYLFELGSASFNTGSDVDKAIQQLVGGAPIAGVSVDYDDAFHSDWGQFPYIPPSMEEDMILTHLHDGQAVVVCPAESGYRVLGPEMQAWFLSAGYQFKPPLPQNPPLKNLGPFSAV